MKKISLVVLIYLTITIGFAQEIKKDYSDAFKLIEVWLEAQKDFNSIPSIMAMVVKDQELLWSGAFGKSNIEQNINAKTSTVSCVCSMTKTFTAVAIMKLVDDGKLNLDDKVKDILPFYAVKQKFPEGGAVTVRSMLSHISGLPRDSGHSYYSVPDFPFPSEAELRSKLKDLETENPVNTNLKYSNVGYALLGQIIEKVSGMSYDEYLTKEVLNPLGMTNSYIELQNNIYGTKYGMKGYTALNRDRTRNRVNIFETRAMKPAMGLSTTILDLAKYASWQFRLREATAPEILKPSTLRSMHSNQSTSKSGDQNWGFGFGVNQNSNGDNMAWHGGTCPGYVSMLQLNLETKMAYAIMINANKANTWKYINGIKHIMSLVKPIKNETKPEFDFEDYIGYYNMNPWNSEVYISTWNEGLVMLQLPADRLNNYNMQFFKHIKNDTFRYVDDNGELGDKFIFERDENGRVYRYFEGSNYKNKIVR